MESGPKFAQPVAETPQEEKEETLRKFHIRKLQEPHIQSFFKYLRSEPHLWDQVLARYERRDDFLSLVTDIENGTTDRLESVDDTEKIRRLAPLWSAIATVPEARAYFELIFDEAAATESDQLKEQMETQKIYVDQLVVGAGLHGSIYNQEMNHDNPGISRLTIEGDNRLGGQFRKYKGPVIRMNTPNRPINKNIETEYDNPLANPLGEHAPVQLPDISGNLFTTNMEIGLASAVNQYLSSDTLLSTEMTGVRLDPEGQGVEVTLSDRETGKTYTIVTKRVIASIGLGIPDYGFPNMDEATLDMCNSGQVFTYGEFLEMVGDRSNPFPMEKFKDKKIVIIGGGHSGLTAAEYLSGQGPEYRGSVTALGSPSEIIILGTKFDNGQQLLSGELPRYAQLAALIQSGEMTEGSKAKLISAKRGIRAIGLKKGEAPGKITLICKHKGDEGNTEVAPNEIEADIVISTTGFTSNINEIFKDMIDETSITTPREFMEHLVDVDDESHPEDKAPFARCLPGCANIVFVGPAANLSADPKELKRSATYGYPTNPVALINTALDTAECARYFAEKDKDLGKVMASNDLARVFKDQPRNKVYLDLSPGMKEPRSSFAISIEESDAELGFPPEIRYEDILDMAANYTAAAFEAEQSQSLVLKIVRESNENGASYQITTDRPVSADFEKFLSEYFKDKLVQRALAKLTVSKVKRPESVEISVAFRGPQKSV